jgi:nucleotidyltransferase substrate binding protein (TIGR01987 family)
MASGDEDGVRLARFRQTLAALEEVLPNLPSVPASILRDSRIQRFEFTFEATWKLLQATANAEGLEGSSPRKAFQYAISTGLLDPEDETTAWDLLRYRNLTVHTYDENLAAEVEEFILDTALPLFRKIAARTDT